MNEGEALRDARLATGLTQTEFGLALGYQHRNPKNVKGMISAMETGKRAVTPAIARLAAMYARFGVPAEFRENIGPELINHSA